MIAVIAILASLILPALAAAQKAARSAKCKGNLHQLGVGTAILLADTGRYPMQVRDIVRGYAPSWGSGPQKSKRHQPDSITACPREIRLSRRRLDDGTFGQFIRRPSYRYNAAGTASGSFVIGLDVITELPVMVRVDGEVRRVLGFFGVPEHWVAAPSDGVLVTCPNNGLFADAHVTSARATDWTSGTVAARRRLNHDHEPHLDIRGD